MLLSDKRYWIQPTTDTPETLILNASVGRIPARHSPLKHQPRGGHKGFLRRPAVSWKTSIHASMELDPQLGTQTLGLLETGGPPLVRRISRPLTWRIPHQKEEGDQQGPGSQVPLS